MKSEVLEQVSSNDVACPVTQYQQEVHSEDEVVGLIGVCLMEVAQHVGRDVSPEEEAAEVEGQEDASNEGHDSISLFTAILLAEVLCVW
jgi:hypothetical protein